MVAGWIVKVLVGIVGVSMNRIVIHVLVLIVMGLVESKERVITPLGG